MEEGQLIDTPAVLAATVEPATVPEGEAGEAGVEGAPAPDTATPTEAVAAAAEEEVEEDDDDEEGGEWHHVVSYAWATDAQLYPMVLFEEGAIDWAQYNEASSRDAETRQDSAASAARLPKPAKAESPSRAEEEPPPAEAATAAEPAEPPVAEPAAEVATATGEAEAEAEAVVGRMAAELLMSSPGAAAALPPHALGALGGATRLPVAARPHPLHEPIAREDEARRRLGAILHAHLEAYGKVRAPGADAGVDSDADDDADDAWEAALARSREEDVTRLLSFEADLLEGFATALRPVGDARMRRTTAASRRPRHGRRR